MTEQENHLMMANISSMLMEQIKMHLQNLESLCMISSVQMQMI